MQRLGAVAVFLTVAAAAVHPAAAATTRPLGRIVIPAIALDVAFANAASPEATANGPGHYPSSALPGQGRTVAIAGHRVTHTHPFRRLGELVPGRLIAIRFGAAPAFRREACYRVRRITVVRPEDVRVLRDVGVDRLVLTTCTPPGTAWYRLVVIARRASCPA